MQKTKFIHAAVLCAMGCLPFTGLQAQTSIPMQSQLATKLPAQTPDSVQTVDALLKAENKAANDKLRSIAEAAAPPKPYLAPKQVKKTGPASVAISGIFGVEGSLRTNITYEGQNLPAKATGERVGPCEIVAIQGSCVVLRKFVIDTSKSIPAGTSLTNGEQVITKNSKKSAFGSKKAPKAEKELGNGALMCPSACWTAPAQLTGASSGSFGGGLQSPPGAFPAAGASRFPVPSIMPQPVPSAGANLRSAQTLAPFGMTNSAVGH